MVSGHSGKVFSPKRKARKQTDENEQTINSAETEVLKDLRRRLTFLEGKVLKLETDVTDLKKELSALNPRNVEQERNNESVAEMTESPMKLISQKMLIRDKTERRDKRDKNFETTPLEKDEKAKLNNQIDNEAFSYSNGKVTDDQSSEPSLTNKPKGTENIINSRRNPTSHQTGLKTQSSAKTLECFGSKHSRAKKRSNDAKKDKPLFKCPSCDKSFSSKSTLSSHNKIHTSERSFKCELCLKAFSQKGHLDDHVRRHLGEKAHQCRLCKLNFVSKWELTRHFAQKHATG